MKWCEGVQQIRLTLHRIHYYGVRVNTVLNLPE